MNSRSVVTLVVSAACAVLFAWIALNTYWADEQIQGLRHGEAIINPYYAAEQLLRHLDATADDTGPAGRFPPEHGVIVLARWNWDFYRTRRVALRHWVEAGGRLVTDRSLGDSEDFAAWSGISGRVLRSEARDGNDEEDTARCQELQLKAGETPSDPSAIAWRLCGAPHRFRWTTSRPLQLGLGTDKGLQVVRVAVGRGSVTAINAYDPFATDSLFDGDHARLLVIATQLHRGDALRITRGDTRSSLAGWLWTIAAPLLLLLAAALVLALWRSLVRFGPLLPAPPPARRSLHAQVAGTAGFLAGHGGGPVLWQALRDSLACAAASRYGQARPADAPALAALLASRSEQPRHELQQALLHPQLDGREGLVRALAALERARRRLLTQLSAQSQRRGTT